MLHGGGEYLEQQVRDEDYNSYTESDTTITKPWKAPENQEMRILF